MEHKISCLIVVNSKIVHHQIFTQGCCLQSISQISNILKILLNSMLNSNNKGLIGWNLSQFLLSFRIILQNYPLNYPLVLSFGFAHEISNTKMQCFVKSSLLNHPRLSCFERRNLSSSKWQWCMSKPHWRKTAWKIMDEGWK